MNSTIAYVTMRGMIGRRRLLLLLALPATLVVLAVVLRLGGAGDEAARLVLQRFGLATLLPLVALIATTGVLGPELDDGTIVFLLSTPVSRPALVHTKLAIAAALTVVFAAVPMLVAGLVLVGTSDGLALAFAAGAAAGGLAYCAIFGVVTVAVRHAVIIGLIYTLVWEGVVGGFVPGARELSVQQWALSVASALSAGHTLAASVAPGAALALLVVVTAGATALAGQRLRSFSLNGEA